MNNHGFESHCITQEVKKKKALCSQLSITPAVLLLKLACSACCILIL